MSKAQLWWTGFTAYATAVLTVSIIPVPQVGPQIPSLDKLLHLLEYLLFSWLLMHAQLASGRPNSSALTIAIVGAIGYGSLCEVLQWYLPYREAEGWDILANTVGGVLGAMLVSEPRQSRGESNHG